MGKAALLAQEYRHRRARGTDRQMIRRLPVIPTIVVAAAVAVMIGLGMWQLQRAKWKEGLLARICAGREGAADHLADGAAAQGAIAAVPPCDRGVPAAHRRARGRRRKRGRRTRLRPDHRLPHRRRRAGDERRGRLVERSEREDQLGGRAGQRDHRARPPDGHAAGRGDAAAPGLQASAPPSDRSRSPTTIGPTRSNGSPSP